MAQDAWTGGDDLPTNPLACDGSAARRARQATMTAARRPARPTARARRSRSSTCRSSIGVGYFAADDQGHGRKRPRNSATSTVTTDGPTEANIDEQITFIDNYITHGVDGILFAANDPVAIAPVLKKALEAGINVVGYDANSEPDARQWFVNQAEFNGIAKSLIDQMATEIGEDGSFAIVTSTFTTPNQARWIAEMAGLRRRSAIRSMKWLETVEAQEDNILSFNQAKTLINKYGDELKGIFGMTSVATPAAAEAVHAGRPLRQGRGRRPRHAERDEALRQDRLRQVGRSCWNPVDLGYAAVQAMRAVVDGTLKPGDTESKAGRLGKLQVVNGSEILLGAPYVFTKDNINDFDF